MQGARARLVWLAVTAVLFVAWVGWMAFEVWSRPVVLARAPFLVSDLNVIAQVARLDAPVVVRTVTWSAAEGFYRDRGPVGAALAGAPAGPLAVPPFSSSTAPLFTTVPLAVADADTVSKPPSRIVLPLS